MPVLENHDGELTCTRCKATTYQNDDVTPEGCRECGEPADGITTSHNASHHREGMT